MIIGHLWIIVFFCYHYYIFFSQCIYRSCSVYLKIIYLCCKKNKCGQKCPFLLISFHFIQNPMLTCDQFCQRHRVQREEIFREMYCHVSEKKKKWFFYPQEHMLILYTLLNVWRTLDMFRKRIWNIYESISAI